MFKHTIKFNDFDGKEAKMVIYFNLTKTECVDLNLAYEDEGGLIAHIKKIMAEKEDGQIRQKPAVDFVRTLVDKAYGVRPKDDPSLFLKEDDNGRPYIRRFKQSAAYDEFVYGLLTGEIPLDEFTEKVLPPVNEAQKAEATKMLEAEGLGNVLHEV